MKKLILISALLFSFNGFTEPSTTTSNLFYDKSVPFITFALAMCKVQGNMKERTIDNSFQKIKFKGCHYNYDRDKLIIYFSKDQNLSSKEEDNRTPMQLCEQSIENDLSVPWKVTDREVNVLDYIVTGYLESFYENGIVEVGRSDKVSKWLTDNLEVYTFIGNDFLLSDEKGILCMYRMGRDSYTTYREQTYLSMLEALDNS